MRRSWIVVPLVLALGASVAGCTGDDDEPGPDRPTPTQAGKVTLTFGVWGSGEEIAAYQGVIDTYNAVNAAEGDHVKVKIKAYTNHDDLAAALASGEVPDVFQVSRGDLAVLRDQELNRPIGELLDERGVDFGDGYSRPALEAFSGDRELQCMPYGISPMVIYYNTDLIDFERMRQLGLPAPEDDLHEEWTFEQFTAAAQFATRPRRDTRGVHIDGTLRGLSPFIYSGGGEIFDDDENPTSLALSEDDSRDALTRTLELLRDASLNLTDEQLVQATPVEWFKRGKLGMVAGFRELTPELRQVDGLNFDVMPMPILEDDATVGDITGLCVSPEAPSIAKAADFLVYVVSRESVARVAAEGYLAPANLPVAVSDDFLQPTQMPAHAGVFTRSVRSMVVPPLVDDWPALERAVAVSLKALLTVTVPDVEALTTQIDEESRAVLDPELASPSPSDGESSD